MSSITFEQRDATFFARMGWLLTLVGAGGFFLWASLAPLDQGIPVQGTVVVSGPPGTEGFGAWFEGRGGADTHQRHQRVGGETPSDVTRLSVGADETDADEYDEHEVVPFDQTVYVCRGEVCFAPATTVQEARTALWSRA